MAALLRRQEELRARRQALSRGIVDGLRAASAEAATRFPSIARVIVFGSVLRGRAAETSDVDVLVEGIRAEEYFPLRRFLCEHLEREVDLHTETEPAAFLDKVRARGECIHESRG